eukprot:805189-Rhodomonas_salina.1
MFLCSPGTGARVGCYARLVLVPCAPRVCCYARSVLTRAYGDTSHRNSRPAWTSSPRICARSACFL